MKTTLARLAGLLPVLFLIGPMLLVSSCEDETDKALEEQLNAIQRYLDGQDVDYIVDRDVFITVLANTLPAGSAPVKVERGDSVKFMFAAYRFSGSGGGSALPFYTNIRQLAEQLEGLDTQFWSFDPLAVKLGATTIITGLDIALPYCHSGDSVAVYMTSEMAYGDKAIGMVDKNTALRFVLQIEEVKKNE